MDMIHARLSLAVAIVTALSRLTCVTAVAGSCRFLPGDAHWPSISEWELLNDTLHGRLEATVPLASICHGTEFDAAACNALKNDWANILMHEESPSSILAPYYQNRSCDPFTDPSTACLLGNYAVYSIAASSAEDIAAGINFARAKNVRLVIKNTGHDYLGRSSGHGSLAIWTHNLRATEFLPSYQSSYYTGPALKLGAGVRAFEALDVAHAHGVRAIIGFCPTVGIAGGFLLGGGSGPLSSVHGMASDQVLEYEVVLASGEIIIASPIQHPKLYWALSGGGGGTYGVVVSVTIRVFEDGPVGGAALSISRQDISTDIVYELFGHVLDLTPSLIDSGIQFGFHVTPAAFEIQPVTGPGHSIQDISTLLQPFVSELERRKIKYSLQLTSFPDFKSHYEAYLGPTPGGRYHADAMGGSRLITRAAITTHKTQLIKAARDITENTSAIIIFIAANVTSGATKQPVSQNSVLPQWREAAIHALVILPWDFRLEHHEMLGIHSQFTNQIMPQLRDALPPSGTYLSEADAGITNWKEDFFGANYENLRQIKGTYDPTDLFYVTMGVGSDVWYVGTDGRLCRSAPVGSGSQQTTSEQYHDEL